MMNKKLVTMIGALALVGAIGIGSTWAYLTSSSNTVQNTFSVGNTGGKVDEEDLSTADENDRTQTGNTYSDIVANQTLDKDPTVYIQEGAVTSYVFIKVTGMANNNFTYNENHLTDSSIWVQVAENAADNWVIYRYANTVAGPAENSDGVVDYTAIDTLFTGMTAASTITGETTFNNITVQAAYVQAEGVTEAEALTQARGAASWN